MARPMGRLNEHGSTKKKRYGKFLMATANLTKEMAQTGMKKENKSLSLTKQFWIKALLPSL